MLRLPAIIRSRPLENELPFFYRGRAAPARAEKEKLKEELALYDRRRCHSFSKTRYLRFLKDRPRHIEDVVREVQTSISHFEPRNCSRSVKLEKVQMRREMELKPPRLRVKT
jgi:hypothetical protein